MDKMISAESFYPEYPALVTVVQLGKILGIGRNKAYELLSTGTLRSVRVGRKHMIPKALVLDFVNKQICAQN